jgi:tetratricopeptide (TPR) repeat protein
VTPRVRAEAQLVEGNRAYDAAAQLAGRGDAASGQAALARFGDAVGYYKAALNLDRSLAVAHRGKGAALARLQRWDEAAAAYREYLAADPEAIDGVDVREALSRRGVEAPAAARPGAGGG